MKYEEFEADWWAHKRRKRRLWTRAVEKCKAACEKEHAFWLSFLSIAVNVQPQNKDMFWEQDKEKWLVSAERKLLLLSCQEQARIWVTIRQELVTALEAMEAP